MIKDVIKNILYTILLFIVPLFFGLIQSFLFVRMLPGDPVVMYLAAQGISTPSPAQYSAAVQLLGFDQPLNAQFFRYVFELFTGDLGDFCCTFAKYTSNPIFN